MSQHIVWGLGILYWLRRVAHNLRFGVWADADLGFGNFRMAPEKEREERERGGVTNSHELLLL